MLEFNADNGNYAITMNALGFGTYLIPPRRETYRAVLRAIESGYRSIDTAKFYENEQDVGRAVADSGLSTAIDITSKVWNDEQGFDAALEAGKRTADYLKRPTDLLLIHWPGSDKFVSTWEAFLKLKEEGYAMQIGVSNFHSHHIEVLQSKGLPLPIVNQIELHPLLSQEDEVSYCQEKGILVESWGPLIRGKFDELETLSPIAARHNKSRAQVILRWIIQRGIRALPKSVHVERMKKNIDIFDFTLTDVDMAKISGLNKNFRTGPNPDELLF